MSGWTIPYENRPDDFEFLPLFSTLTWIQHKNTTTSSIFNVLNSSLSDNEFRDLIKYGITSYYTKRKNFKIVESIHNGINQFNTNQTKMNVNKSNNTNTDIQIAMFNINGNTNACDQTFSIQSIVCKIFSYLDLVSLCKCSRVNMQWLYDSHHPSSIYHINIKALFDFKLNRNKYKNMSDPVTVRVAPLHSDIYKHSPPPQRTHTITTHLSRFKQITSVSTGNLSHLLDRSHSCIPEKFVKMLTRVKKLDIIDFLIENRALKCFVNKTMILLKENQEHLESIRISTTSIPSEYKPMAQDVFNKSNYPVWNYICDNIERFHKLERIELCCGDTSSRQLKSFPKVKNTRGGLKVLKLSGVSYYPMSFWESLIENEKNLCNLEGLTLKSPRVTKQNAFVFRYNIIPAICARIMQKNLKRIELIKSDQFSKQEYQYESMEFFGVHFLNEIILSMKKLGFFSDENNNNNNNNNNVKFGCCVDMEKREFGVHPSSMNLEVFSLKKSRFGPVLPEFQRLSAALEYRFTDYRGYLHEIPFVDEFLNNLIQVEVRLSESLSSSGQLLDILCFGHDRNSDKNEDINEKSIATKSKKPKTKLPSEGKTKANAKAKTKVKGKTTNKETKPLQNKQTQTQNNNAQMKITTVNATTQQQQQGDKSVDSIDTRRKSNIDVDSNPFETNTFFNNSNKYTWSSSFDTFAFGSESNINEFTNSKRSSFGSANYNFNLNNTCTIVDNESKRVTNIEKLTINGRDKITIDLIFETLNNLTFKNNCLKYIKLFGLKSNDFSHVDPFRKPFEDSIKFFKNNINSKVDIKVSKIIALDMPDWIANIYASELIALFSQTYNNLLNQNKNKNSFKICILTNVSYSIRNSDVDANSTAGSKWIDTLLNGLRKMSSIDSSIDEETENGGQAILTCTALAVKDDKKEKEKEKEGKTKDFQSTAVKNVKINVNGGVLNVKIERFRDNDSLKPRKSPVTKLCVQVELMMYSM